MKIVFEIKEFVKRILPKKIWNVCSDFVQSCYNKKYRRYCIKKYKYREREVCYGNEYPDKTFYLIRRESMFEGHFSMFNSILGHLKECDDRGMIPIVDMQNYYSEIWQSGDKKYKENAWEYFFLQPSNYSLEDIVKSKKVVLSFGIDAKEIPGHKEIYFHKNEIEKWHSIYKKYIKLNKETIQNIRFYEDKFDMINNRILGVSLRRGINWGHETKDAYAPKDISYAGYSTQPELEMVMEDIDDLMKKWDCQYVFVVTDDQEATEIIRNRLQEKIFIVERKRMAFFHEGKPIEKLEPPEKDYEKFQKNKFQDGLDYITEIFLLAKCDSIICGRTSGNAAAFVINGNKYKNVKVY